MAEARKARVVGFNHVAIEVGDIEEALAFYGRLFDFKLRGKDRISAFIDLGDQFLALQKGRTQPADEGRHFGLVVDDKDAVRKGLAEAGIRPLPGPFLQAPAGLPGEGQYTPEEQVNVAVYEAVNRSVVNINTKTVTADRMFLSLLMMKVCPAPIVTSHSKAQVPSPVAVLLSFKVVGVPSFRLSRIFENVSA